jgi:NAD(P)-dependent dehydrogenase (short-subunit alcohol dehydrogenase family)
LSPDIGGKAGRSSLAPGTSSPATIRPCSPSRALAIEYASRGVRVNAVSLGVIQTPLNAEEGYESLVSLHPLGRVGQISDVVDGILFLESSPFVTGEILHIDGGQIAGH